RAAEKVRYVGEGVAVVVADSRYLAEDALELIEVEYEPLPAVTDPERALDAGAPPGARGPGVDLRPRAQLRLRRRGPRLRRGRRRRPGPAALAPLGRAAAG